MQPRVPTPPILLPASFFLFTLAIAAKSSVYRQAALVPIVGITIYAVHYTTLGEPGIDHRVATTLTGLAFTALEHLVLTDPLTELRTIEQDKPAIMLPFWSRFKWALRLVFSPRLIGWNVEPSNVLPPRPEITTTSSFVLQLCLKLAGELLLLDAVGILASLTPTLSSDGPGIHMYPWMWRSVYVAQFGLANSISVDVSHKVWTLALLATGVCKPSAYRPLFGSWSQSYTVRNFWGRTWHQMLRRRFKVFSQFVTQFLGLPRGRLSSFTELCIAFFVSGAVHYWAEYMPLNHWGGGSLRFFLFQAVAISGETTLISLATRFGVRESRLWRFLGYLWVWQWLTWSVPLWIGPLLRAGVMENPSQVGILRAVCSLLKDPCPLH